MVDRGQHLMGAALLNQLGWHRISQKTLADEES